MSIFNSPIYIGQMLLKNRLVMPPMATAKSSPEGQVTSDLCDYYSQRAAGGHIGLIITEHSYISPEGKASDGQLSISCDSDIDGLSQLTDVIHAGGSRVMAQLNHAGFFAKVQNPKSASAVPNPRTGAIPEEMSLQDIHKVIADFAAAAVRAKNAGFDGVEIHSAHGYLLNQFFSPLTNKRTDMYGGSSVERRLALHLDVIRAIRGSVGDGYPIALRLGACDYMEGGSTIEDGVQAARILEQAGIDMLDISGGFCGFVRPDVSGQGYFGELTEAIKGAVSVPVVLAGGITDSAAAEKLLEDGKADLIGVGRAILQDPTWPERAFA